MRYVSLFSGIEAASVAWEPLGFEPMAFAEVEPFPCAVLAHRWPDVPNLGDVTKIDWGDFLATGGKPDVVVGGSPCQSFSVAGRREGLRGASGLMWEYVRAIQELRPRWLVWENVPGTLSSSRGEDFGCLLRSLDDLGYGLAWRVLDAQFFGVAQRRRRVFLVGSLGSDRAGEVLLEPEGLSGDHPSSREKRQALAAAAGRGAASAGGGCLNPWDSQSRRVYDADGAMPALQTRGASGGDAVGVLVPAGFKWHQGASAGSIGYSPELSPTVLADKQPAVLYSIPENRTYVMATGQANAEVTEGMSPTLNAAHEQPIVAGAGAVRRLTPLECERLMGFPDHYTNIPYKGKDHPPDTPRYKALGNSMCVNVMRWIGERIEGVDA